MVWKTSNMIGLQAHKEVSFAHVYTAITVPGLHARIVITVGPQARVFYMHSCQAVPLYSPWAMLISQLGLPAVLQMAL